MSDMHFHMWEVTKQHLGENGETVAVELQDPDGWFDVNVRWDGLLEMHLYHNAPKGEQTGSGEPPSEEAPFVDTLHLGDLDGFIRRLQELKTVCQELFDFRNSWRAERDDADADV